MFLVTGVKFSQMQMVKLWVGGGNTIFIKGVTTPSFSMGTAKLIRGWTLFGKVVWVSRTTGCGSWLEGILEDFPRSLVPVPLSVIPGLLIILATSSGTGLVLLRSPDFFTISTHQSMYPPLLENVQITRTN